MNCISLMTDFGIKDGNVGVMKGVIWGINPSAQIADLSHMIAAQDILEAAFILGRSAPYFPAGSVHVVVVDPGVGTSRRPVAARLGSQYFVGPDNGVMTVLLEWAEQTGAVVEIVHLNRPRFWLAQVSDVFHGRDIFSPVAAHLAGGVPLSELGEPVYDPVRLELPRPRLVDGVWQAMVVHIDHFGNLSTNLTRQHLAALGANVAVRLRGYEIRGLVRTFGERPAGELIGLYGSTGNLIISVVNASAQAAIHAQVGDRVEVRPIV